MTVVYSQATINARLNDVVTQLSSAATLILADAGNLTLASIPLANPAGSVAGGVLSFSTPVTGSVLATGSPVSAKITAAGGGTVISGLTVSSGAGSDIVLNSPILTAGQLISLTLGQILGR